MDWFLIYQNEHLGPYDEKSLEDLYSCGDINKDSLIWKEGMSEALSYEHLFFADDVPEFVSLKDSSEIIQDDQAPGIPIDHIDEKVAVTEPPPLPLSSDSELEEEFTPPPLPLEMNETEGEAKASSKFFLWACGISLILGLAAFLALPFIRPISFSRPEGMSVQSYKNIEKKLQNRSDENIFFFELSRDKKTIWIVTNSHLEGSLQFKFSSQGLMTLGPGVVEIQGEAYLKNHLIEIKSFDLIQGTGFIDGHYNVELKSVGHLSFPLKKIALNTQKTKINLTERRLISSLSSDKFEKAVANKFRIARNNDRAFFQNLKEEYRTVQTITTEILKGVSKVFAAGDVNYTEAIGQFEQSYKSNYGVFFTSFVLSVDKKYQIINKKKFPDKVEVISHYTKLKNLAKTIGLESVNLLNKLKSKNFVTMTAEQLKEFEYQETIKLKEIISECDKMILSLH